MDSTTPAAAPTTSPNSSPVILTEMGEPLYLVNIGEETSYLFWEEVDLLLRCGTVPRSAVPDEFFEDDGS